MTTTKSYDYLNRLTSISSANASSVVLDSHAYAYNNANQRTGATNADGTYWIYQYDSLGQVISGIKYWPDNTVVAGQQFGYAFDDIGNRTGTSAGGDQWGANLRYANYTANTLNQYTSRTVPGAVDIIGVATNTATVTVNNQPTYRKGTYYRAQLPLNNGSGAVYQSVTNLAVLNRGGTNQDILTNITGNVFLPQNPESFTYDADGNLTQDGRWTYSWDAESRLVNLTSLGGNPSASRLKIDCSYDSEGRRNQKMVSAWNGTTYVPQSTNRFVYDDWNLIATSDGNDNLLYAFNWGADISDSQVDAAGIGGAICVTVYSVAEAGTYLYCYSGNGDATALVNVSNAAVAADYEYGPFGEALRASGPMAEINTLRFSTKYQDDETGLLYYNYRYYNGTIGTWASRDPINEGGGLNPYTFVRNQPTLLYDVLGEKDDAMSEIRTAVQKRIDTYQNDTTIATTGLNENLVHFQQKTETLLKGAINGKVPGNVGAFYDSNTKTIIIPNKGNVRPDAIIHELSHAKLDLEDHFPQKGAAYDRQNEGMGYTMADFDNIAYELHSMEGKSRSMGCDEAIAKLKNEWPGFWNKYGSIPGSGWGTGSVVDGPQGFSIIREDYNNTFAYFRVRLSCAQVAAALNAILAQRGCCCRVSCAATSSDANIIPAQHPIDYLFQ